MVSGTGEIDILGADFTHLDVATPGSDFTDLGPIGRLARDTRVVKIALDKAIRKSYPHIFYSRTLTRNDWSLDGCCGSNLSGDINVFLRNSLIPRRKHIFTFGEGTKLPNTHIGTVSLWFESNNHGYRQSPLRMLIMFLEQNLISLVNLF